MQFGSGFDKIEIAYMRLRCFRQEPENVAVCRCALKRHLLV